MASVAAAVSRRAATVSEDVYEVTRREIPELGDDQTVLALFASSIDSNVSTCLQIMQHQIDLAAVHAPAAALEEARRRAQRGTAADRAAAGLPARAHGLPRLGLP